MTKDDLSTGDDPKRRKKVSRAFFWAGCLLAAGCWVWALASPGDAEGQMDSMLFGAVLVSSIWSFGIAIWLGQSDDN